MAIVQISRIQQRRGLQQDLPQLASAEFGWSLDQRRLFIGNGTTEEGAPTEGVTEILTQHSDLLALVASYTFSGTESGYTSQTGPSLIAPITRTVQAVLDEACSVRDFGAKGDGVTDDTVAINRAIQQIYLSTLNTTWAGVRRTILFPAGVYKVTSPILVPPNASLIGDGKNNSIITSSVGTPFSTCDSKFQTGASLGTNSASLPSYIDIRDMTLATTSSGTDPATLIDSASDISFTNVIFSGGATPSILVKSSSTAGTTKDIAFDNCVFSGGVTGFGATGATVGVQIVHSTFTGQSSVGVAIGSYINGLATMGNNFGSLTTPVSGLTGNNVSIGDTFTVGDQAGAYIGAAKIGTGRALALSTGTTTITTLTTGSGTIDYQINDASNNYRFGTFKYNMTATTLIFDDEYSEPAASLGANLYANTGGTLTCTVSGASTIKYNIKKFI
ncbi:Pectate lyase superfamily protein [uncultured Caudovirales phage]|uniref:Pectate lyase superfamily protein n=1 Tax=uncultured Caudovirales phage TaxID=2100421 RepID=A0A6J5L7E7_9CAUD|nr:Pectate lyase superfamily protein [uncultured Caudovirales phage]